MISTVEEGFAYLESFVDTERGDYKPRTWRLSRMRHLLDDFGNPQYAYRTVHVTGSKGKGSTSCYIAAICAAHGHRVGLYTSPHLVSYRERVRVLDGSLSDEKMVDQFQLIEQYIDSRRKTVPEARLPTTFELLTLFGFLCFRAVGCSIAVAEVGLGGRLDATSLVRAECCVITPIELEHTEYLGNTLRSIAGEKGAIMRKGVPAFSSAQHPETAHTLSRIAELRSTPLSFFDDVISNVDVAITRTGTRCSFHLAGTGTITATLKMLGTAQGANAALATLAARSVLTTLDRAATESGLSSATLPGRSELIPGDPPMLLDGGHTPRSVALVTETVRSLYPDGTGTVIFGSVAGKEHRAMLRTLARAFEHVVICRPGTFKSSDPEELFRICTEEGGSCSWEDDAVAAVEQAKRNGEADVILVTGSFYLAGKIRDVLPQPADASRPNPGVTTDTQDVTQLG